MSTSPEISFDRWGEASSGKPTEHATIEVYEDYVVDDIEDLPQGPRVVARKVAFPWVATWRYSRSSVAECHGVYLVDESSERNVWAVWIDRKFEGAYLYLDYRSIVPRVLKAKELKDMLAEEADLR